ncbi:MAG: hypothetical protein AMXMBFR23_05730 [Chloroflexota bacterium]
MEGTPATVRTAVRVPRERSWPVSSAAVRRYGGAALVCFALCWTVSLAWWLLLPDARIVSIEVPAGTSAAIARGEAVSVIPDRLLLRRGDTLAIRNDDTVVHQVGTDLVPPATTLRIPVTDSLFASGSLSCSIHPNGVLALSPLARPSLASTAIPTLLAGVPTSISAIVALAVVHRLGRDEEDEA